MKVLTIAGEPFVRLEGQTLTPVEALQLLEARVAEATQQLNEAGQERQQAQFRARCALENGQPVDRRALNEADQAVDAANRALDPARGALQRCRHAITTHQANQITAELHAATEKALARFPL